MNQKHINNDSDLLKELSPIPDQKPILIGIDGRPGSGKTTLATKLEQEAQAIYLDEFFIPRREWPQDRTPRFPFFYFRYQEFVDGIKGLAVGKPFTYYAYDCEVDAPSKKATTITPEGIIIIEGVSVLNTELAPLYFKKIWVDSDRMTEMAAIEAREKGTNLDLWKTIYLPSTEIYCLQKPWERADIIFAGRGIQ